MSEETEIAVSEAAVRLIEDVYFMKSGRYVFRWHVHYGHNAGRFEWWDQTAWVGCREGLPIGLYHEVPHPSLSLPDPVLPEPELIRDVECWLDLNGEWNYLDRSGVFRSIINATADPHEVFVNFGWDLPDGGELTRASYQPRWWKNGGWYNFYVAGAVLLTPHIHFFDDDAVLAVLGNGK